MKAFNETQLFDRIRDIPYRTSDDSAQSCFDKCIVLKRELDAHGYVCDLMIGDFYWSDLKLPKEIMKFCNKNAESHVFLRVKAPIGGDWMNLDPTVDAALCKYFTVEHWNGRSSTGILTPLTNIRVYRPFSFLERTKSKARRLFHRTEPNKAFYKAFDSWLDDMRLAN